MSFVSQISPTPTQPQGSSGEIEPRRLIPPPRLPPLKPTGLSAAGERALIDFAGHEFLIRHTTFFVTPDLARRHLARSVFSLANVKLVELYQVRRGHLQARITERGRERACLVMAHYLDAAAAAELNAR